MMVSSPCTFSLLIPIALDFKALRASPLEDMMAVLSAKKSTMEIPAFKSAAAISYWGTPSNTDRKVFSSIFLKVSEVAFPKRIWEAYRARV